MKTKITKENYEAYLLDKAEGNISNEDLVELDAFLKENPELKPKENEYDENIRAIYNSSIHYPNKESLIKKQTTIIPFIIRITSIAACLVLVVVLSLFVFNKQDIKQVAKQTDSENIKDKSEKSVVNNEKSEIKTNRPIIKRKEEKKQIVDNVVSNAITLQKDTIKQEKKQDIKKNDNAVQVNYLVTYEKGKEIDTVYIYTNQLITYSEEKPKRKFYFNTSLFEPITINLASLKR
ncbi:MAG: hypothetical protein LKE30_02410 [Bacteroidales bacterium]|jgi:hypothetical protein|nr:hypothetical protein [Bacteroidales bacterium]